MFHISTDKTYIHSDSLNRDLFFGFGTKKLGDGRDKNALRKYFKDKFSPVNIVFPKQIHSADVIVFKDQVSLTDQCDAVVTKKKDTILTVITADCLPIVYVDDLARVIAISHQGWKGTLNRLPAKVVDTMLGLGSLKKNIHCIFGPAINDCCYEIYGQRLENFKNEFQMDDIFRKTKQKYFLNLYKANFETLTKKGIPPKNVDFFPFCTSCDLKNFYSYHRDRKIAGEMISFVMLY